DVQNAALNSVYRRVIGMRRWPFLEVLRNQDIVCTVGQDAYSLGLISDLLHVDGVRAEYGSQKFELEYLSPQEFRDYQHAHTDNGVPEYWTKAGSRLYIWRRPDRPYVLSIDYVKRPPDLVSDEDQTVLDPVYLDVLVWGAIAELCFRQRDVEGYEMAKNEYGTRLIDMMNDYGVRQRQTSSQVVRSGTFDYLDISEDFPWPAS